MKKEKCELLKIPVTGEEFSNLNYYVQKFNDNKSKYKYNFLGLFGFYVDRPLHRANHYFCSEFVAEVLRKSGIFKSSKPNALVRAIDFVNIEGTIKVFEGELSKYRVSRDKRSAQEPASVSSS